MNFDRCAILASLHPPPAALRLLSPHLLFLWRVKEKENAPLAVIAPPQVADLYRLYPAVKSIIIIEAAHKSWPPQVFEHLKKCQFTSGVLFSNSLRENLPSRAIYAIMRRSGP